MKIRSFALPVVVSAMLVLAGCQQVNNTVAASNPTGVCLNCHSNNAAGAAGGLTGAPLVAKTQLAYSGHETGCRNLPGSGVEAAPSTTTLTETGSGCSKCHTDQGFTSWVENGPGAQASTTDYAAMANTSVTVNNGLAIADTLTCFSCHNPHSTYTMALSTVKPVLLPSGMGSNSYTSSNVYDGGNGNLCVNCHQDRTTPNSVMKALLPSAAGNLNIAISRIEHHGVQGDFLLGADSAGATSTTNPGSGPGVYPVASGGSFTLLGSTSVTYTLSAGGGYLVSSAVPTFAKSVHYSSKVGGFFTSPSDTCVTCHVDLNGSTSGGEQSPHGMYMSVGSTDNVSACTACHTGSFTYTAIGSTTSTTVTKTAYDSTNPVAIPATTGQTLFSKIVDNTATGKVHMSDILLAEQTLLSYFGNGANFFTSATAATQLTAANPGPITSVNTASSAVYVAAVSGTPAHSFDGSSFAYAPVAGNDNRLNNYGGDWVTASPVYVSASSSVTYMDIGQAQAFWNLMLFEEDRSKGVHNPLFAAQLLYDALTLISTSNPANVYLGTSTSTVPNTNLAPGTVVSNWSSARPSTY